MRRTTIMLPADLKTKAARAAQERGISFGELVRRALAAAIQGRSESAYEDPLFADGAVYDGDTPRDLATTHDTYLYRIDDPDEGRQAG